MKHLKGNLREHCQMGHKLELPIGINFMKDVNEQNALGNDVRVFLLHKVGLVGKKNCPWAKDSLDFLACILDENEDLHLWGVEIKSRQVMTTVTEEKEHMRRLRRNKYEVIASKDVNKFIHKRDEIFQLLHHAYVYGFEKVAQVVGDKEGKVLNCTVISYESSMLDSYGNVVEKLKDEVLDWAYDNTPVSDLIVPENILNLCLELPTVNCKEAFYSSFKLWKHMFHDTTILPRPTLQRIIPRSHAKWNAGKPGSDTVTKICDNCVFCPPKVYTNFETKAIGRCFTNLTATVLHLFQVSSSKKI